MTEVSPRKTEFQQEVDPEPPPVNSKQQERDKEDRKANADRENSDNRVQRRADGKQGKKKDSEARVRVEQAHRNREPVQRSFWNVFSG